MKITSSAVAMSAKSSLSQKTAKTSNLQFWVGDRERPSSNVSIGDGSVKVELSDLAKRLSQQAKALQRQQTRDTQAADDGQTDGLTDKDRQAIQILDALFHRLTGKHLKFRTLDFPKLQSQSNPVDLSLAAPASNKAGFGLIYDSSEIHTETASMSFQASGQVQTEDGRTIDFSAALSMSRQFQSDNEIHIRAGDALKDPLVINISGAPQLSGKSFSFDIDNDGKKDQISQLMTGSGFLALDKNGNGEIDNGSELFGPTNGDGFAELKAYDSDGNGWIDENDAVYDKLRVWMADDKGGMQLMALGQEGIGAIYLGNVSSRFDIKDGSNDLLGAVQSTGVYLKEDGSAGTIQHIDLSV